MRRIYLAGVVAVVVVCLVELVTGLAQGALAMDQIVLLVVLIAVFALVLKRSSLRRIVGADKVGQGQGSRRGDRFIIAQINDKIGPLQRLKNYEEPLDAALRADGIGEVSGGGSFLSPEKEIRYCDIEISLLVPVDRALGLIQSILEKQGAPKGSKLLPGSDDEREIPFGEQEGLGVYLNGTELPDKVYEECDSNFVIAEFGRLLGPEGQVHGSWQGPRETAIYMYGKSFDEMKRRLADFLAAYPLCQMARIVQIA
jgi:hypothetical protein